MFEKLYNTFGGKKVSHVLRKQIESITAAAFLISITSLVSKILGIVRDRALAGKFGAGEVLDIYYAAFRLPDLIYNLLVLGALSAGFIPVFTSYLSVKKQNQIIKAKDKAWDFVNNVLNSVLLIVGILSIISLIFTPSIIDLLVPGFTPEQKVQTVMLTRVMLLSPLFLSVSSIFGGVLQSFKQFIIFSLAPIVYNLGIIIGIIYFFDSFGLIGLGYGVVLGAFLHMCIQIPSLYRLGYSYQSLLNFKDKGMVQLLKMMGPRTLGLAIAQINLVVITIIASGISSGSLTVFNLAFNLQSVPISLFGISFAIAAFPTMARYADKQDYKNLIKVFSGAVKEILLFVIPITFLYIILRAQIVRLILGSGMFDWKDTIITMDSLLLFSVSLFAQSLIPLIARTFYTLHDTYTPFFVGLLSMIVNIALSLFMVHNFQMFGLSFDILGLILAFTISSILQFVILLIALRARVGFIGDFAVVKTVSKILFAAVIMAIFTQGTKSLIGIFLNIDTVVGIFVQTVGSGLVAVVTFIAVSLLVKNQEMISFKVAFNRKVLRKIEVPQAQIDQS